jgi:hypothetical protein
MAGFHRYKAASTATSAPARPATDPERIDAPEAAVAVDLVDEEVLVGLRLVLRAVPLPEAPEPLVAVALAPLEAETVAVAALEPVARVELPEPLVVTLLEMLLHERSKSGVVLRGLPGATPKLGSRAALLSVSSRVYQKTLALPKRGHPTWSQ